MSLNYATNPDIPNAIVLTFFRPAETTNRKAIVLPLVLAFP